MENLIRIRGISVRKGDRCDQLPLAWLSLEATQDSAWQTESEESKAPTKEFLPEPDSCLTKELEAKVTHVIEQLLQNVLKTADFS